MYLSKSTASRSITITAIALPTSNQAIDYAAAYTVPRRVSFPTMSHTTEHKQELLMRAKRIQGQVEALVRALTEERDCSEVLQVMSPSGMSGFCPR